jgi:hypothetical protein
MEAKAETPADRIPGRRIDPTIQATCGKTDRLLFEIISQLLLRLDQKAQRADDLTGDLPLYEPI